uniref:Retrotransposon gag domain-containing protein n=1 Tax=Cajanus cajan TaxID=3821 RepID=A0A151SLQ4_CAJCA|nr:hypothetical protein KK1_002009 [Cajanus cajan]
MAEEGTCTHNGGHGPARPPRRTLGDYAQQDGPRHFSSIAASNTSRVMEMKPAFLTLVSSQQFAGLDHKNPYSHLSNFYELCGTMGIPEGDEEVVYLRLFPFSLTGKAKVWLQSHPNQSLTSWGDVENKFVNRFYPSSKYIKAKSEITTFRQGADEPFCEAWERFKSLLRKCPNHEFEDIAQLNFFVNGIKPEVKMLLDAATSGTMMTVSPEEATQIIESLTSSDQQDHPNGHYFENSNEEEVNYVGNQPKGGNFNSHNYNTNNYMQGNHGWRNNNNQGYGWRNEVGPSNRPPQQQQQHQLAYPSMHERTSKLEETLNQFMQVSMNNQKNTEASIKNLEVQVGQLAKQLADMSKGPFSSNTKTNPKEYCQAITTRSGKVVGSDIGVSGDNEGADNKEENSKLKAIEEEMCK